MQCCSCGFENLPGLQVCARCAHALGAHGVDCEPPRASRWRWRTRCGRWARHARRLIVGAARTELAPDVGVTSGALVASIVPGLGHVRLGHPATGAVFLALWLAAAALAVANVATERQYGWSLAMLGVHLVGVYTLVAHALWRMSLRRRMGACAVLGLALGVGVYGGAGWLITRFVRPVVVGSGWSPVGAISADDGLLVDGAWLAPRRFQRGTLVMYRVRGYAGISNVIHRGFAFERVLGIPGDVVEIAAGQPRVNGLPPPATPGRPAAPRWDAQLSPRALQADEYFLMPTQVDIGGGAALRELVLEHLVIVRRGDIFGRVLYRLQPPFRRGTLE